MNNAKNGDGKVKKKYVFLIILLLAIGFASITTTFIEVKHTINTMKKSSTYAFSFELPAGAYVLKRITGDGSFKYFSGGNAKWELIASSSDNKTELYYITESCLISILATFDVGTNGVCTLYAMYDI